MPKRGTRNAMSATRMTESHTFSFSENICWSSPFSRLSTTLSTYISGASGAIMRRICAACALPKKAVPSSSANTRNTAAAGKPNKSVQRNAYSAERRTERSSLPAVDSAISGISSMAAELMSDMGKQMTGITMPCTTPYCARAATPSAPFFRSPAGMSRFSAPERLLRRNEPASIGPAMWTICRVTPGLSGARPCLRTWARNTGTM